MATFPVAPGSQGETNIDIIRTGEIIMANNWTVLGAGNSDHRLIAYEIDGMDCITCGIRR